MGVVEDILNKWRQQYRWNQEKEERDYYVMERDWKIISSFISFSKDGIIEDLTKIDKSFEE